jgi:cytochrome P450
MFATVNHDHHKIRRAALNPFFSQQNVRRLQPIIQERVDVLLRRIQDFQKSGEVLNASHLYAAYTNDVVMQYAFARSDHRLEAPDFDPTYRDAAFFGSTASNFMKHAPWLNAVFQAIPDKLTRLTHPAMAAFVAQKRNTAAQIAQIKSGENSMNKDLSHPTIFHELLNSKLPENEKSVIRLSDEAQVLMMAGTLTTAWVLEVSTFYLIRKPELLRRLKEELQREIPDPDAVVPLAVLEQLTFLNAVIKETLRLTYGVAQRLARIADEPLHFTDRKSGRKWVIPPGTPIGMSNAQLHHDETIFPNSKDFIPERWLDRTGTSLDLAMDKYLLSFTRGSRQCLGMPLSYAEMYLSLTGMWGRYGSAGGVLETGERYEGVRFPGDVGVFALHETGLVDVQLYADSFLPLVKPGSKGIMLRVLP